MNLFYLENNHQTILMWLTNCSDCFVRQIDSNYFYYQNNELVGFNIFLDQELQLKPGRILLTPKIRDLLKNKYLIDIGNKKQSNFLIGQIVKLEKIDNTHLSICHVNVNKEVLQIICGASNVKLNLKVVVAPIGIIMNNGLEIKPTKIQGHNSFGMLCSQKELQITKFNDQGIIELDNEYVVGEIFLDCYSN